MANPQASPPNSTAHLAAHDVVYRTPGTEGYEGFPVGNGDLGAMCWTPPDRFFLQINKSNTWDDAPEGLFDPWQDKDQPEVSESFTSLRSCGEFRVEPGLPLLDWMYLEDFEGRLSLGDACASWTARGPLGEARCRIFVADDPAAVCVQYDDALSEAVPRRLVLGRWGSRVFEHWYRYIRRGDELGLPAPRSGCEAGDVWVVQETRSLTFAMAARLAGAEAPGQRFNTHEAGYVLEAGAQCRAAAFISVVTSEEADDCLAEARRRAAEAADQGSERLFDAHRARWARFWGRSRISVPDRYLENLWYVNAYQTASASRGAYPPHFIGSLWSWTRDCRPWNHYYHWNQQQYTWPLHAAGHADLMLPYARWKLEGLERARHAARELHQCEGAFYSDVSNRRGDQGATSPGMYRNLAPSAFTAMDLWRHYEYTLDRDFLETYAYPVLREVVRFYVAKLERWDDGLYHIPEALPNEAQSSCLSSDTTTELAGIRTLFPAFARASEELGLDEELRAAARDRCAHLAEYVVATVPDDAITWGDVEPGDAVMGFGTLLSSGQPGEPWVVRPYWKRDAAMDFPCSYHAVNAQVTPLFPAGLVSLDDAGTPLFEACRSAALSFDPVGNNGHTPLPICLARVGRGDLLPEVLDRWIDRYQLFPQGLCCYFQRDYAEDVAKGNHDEMYNACEHLMLGLTNEVAVQLGDPEERVGLPRRPFAHVGLEAGAVLQATVNEMLLQSHGGTIRVFPAIPADWDCSFRLHAVGAFEVSARCVAGRATRVSVRSHKGGACRLANPWPEEAVVVLEAGGEQQVKAEPGESAVCFETRAGVAYEVRPAAADGAAEAGVEEATSPLSAEPQTRRRASLGIPRRF